MLLSFLEYTRPLRAFRREVRELGTGAIQQLRPERQRGFYRQLSLDINLALERAQGPASSVDLGGISFKEVFGERREPAGLSAYGFPGAQQNHTDGAARMVNQEHTAVVQAAQVPGQGNNYDEASPAYPGAGTAGYPRAGSGEYAPQVDAYSGEGVLGGANHADIDAHWNQVYQDFVRLKVDCGETVDGFTFERFSATLRKNREALRKAHGVHEVHFSVYVKAGKAALKAKPVRS